MQFPNTLQNPLPHIHMGIIGGFCSTQIAGRGKGIIAAPVDQPDKSSGHILRDHFRRIVPGIMINDDQLHGSGGLCWGRTELTY